MKKKLRTWLVWARPFQRLQFILARTAAGRMKMFLAGYFFVGAAGGAPIYEPARRVAIF